MNKHEHICEAIELFSKEVMPVLKEREDERIKRKQEELAPFIAAALARKLGAHLLTETMERRPGIGLDSYDRLFPNQDTLPQEIAGLLLIIYVVPDVIVVVFQDKPHIILGDDFPAECLPLGLVDQQSAEELL